MLASFGAVETVCGRATCRQGSAKLHGSQERRVQTTPCKFEGNQGTITSKKVCYLICIAAKFVLQCPPNMLCNANNTRGCYHQHCTFNSPQLLSVGVHKDSRVLFRRSVLYAVGIAVCGGA